MPVNVDKNLTLKNNVMDASYGELFKKLNVAYGWTHTQTTSSGGTAVVLVNNGDILTTMECNDINTCLMSNRAINNPYPGAWIHCIINGKIYRYLNSQLTQLGQKTDYISVTTPSWSDNSNVLGLDSSGKMWYITNAGVETQIGTDSDWEKLGYAYNFSYSATALKGGKIYMLNSGNTPVQVFPDLTNIVDLYACPDNNNIQGMCIDTNNNLYYISNNSSYTAVGSDISWNKIHCGSKSAVFATDTNNDLYYVSTTSVYKQNISNVKKSSYGYYHCVITNDNKLFIGQSFSSLYGNNYGQYMDISNGMEWSDVTIPPYGNPYNYWFFYAISNGKLYKIIITSTNFSSGTATVSYTQIGTEENYQKIDGIYYGSNNTSFIGLAWTGDATTVSHTVLTTKSPQVIDATYIDKDLTKYSNIQSTTNSTITDEYRTYNRDASKDTNFTAIPPATVHETVSTVDFLRITNPNT